MADSPVETFPALPRQFTLNAFIGRIEGIDVKTERDIALQRLKDAHTSIRSDLGFGYYSFVTAEQVHGNKVVLVDSLTASPVMGVDGLITNSSEVCLGIYVADCCAIYLADPRTKSIGLVHSGKKGTELGIVGNAIQQMETHFGTNPSDVIVQLSPCIRPPHYENDFAAEIVRQCREIGVRNVFDCGRCTASLPEDYYSYRMEKGKTGRMLALLAMTP